MLALITISFKSDKQCLELEHLCNFSLSDRNKWKPRNVSEVLGRWVSVVESLLNEPWLPMELATGTADYGASTF